MAPLKQLTLIIGVIFWGLPAQAACSDGATLRLQLEVTGEKKYKPIEALLRGVSRLAEKAGDCFRSSRRLDGTLRSDIDRFQRVLRSEGFYGARVVHSSALQGDTLLVSISVDPGYQYEFGDVQVVNWNDDGERSDMSALGVTSIEQRIGSGEPARASKVVEAEKHLLAELSNSGYPYARLLERDVVVDHATRMVSVTFNMVAGEQRQLALPSFSGLQEVRESYLEKLVPWKNGQLFKESLLEDYRNRLLATGLFRAVHILVPQKGDDAEVRPLVQVEEALHRRIELAGGYAAGEGFEAEASWTHRNFWGAGESLKLSLLAGEAEQQLGGTFRKPNWRRYEQSMLLRGTIGHENKPAYSADTIDVYAGLERRLGRSISGSVGAEVELARLDKPLGKVTESIFSVPVGLKFDGSNSILDPTRGFRATLTAQPTLSSRAEDTYFLATELRAAAYWHLPAFDQVTWAARVRLGSIWGASLDRVPDTERFYAGGGGSVRGFGYQALGQLDSEGAPVGGLSVAEVGLEARVRLSETISVVPFLDGGMVYDDNTPAFNGWRWGAGLGLRYHTAVAPIRVDLATPLDRRPGESSVAVYISIGQSF